MNKKIFAGVLSLALGFSFVACEDEENYSVATGQMVKEVVTGSSDVTAVSAQLNGTVKGLGGQSASAYSVGFFYGSSEDNLASKVDGSLDGETIKATLTGLTTGQTVYYQAFVTLQKTITYKGDVKSLVTTDAKVTTKDVASINFNDVVLGGTVTGAPAGAVCGVALAASSDVEAVRAGLRVAAESLADDFTLTKAGLLPGTTYFAAAYLDLGTGILFGDVKEFTTKEYKVDVEADFVDLGLSVKWCKFNVGATKETEIGGLFGYGDVTGVNNSTRASDYPATGDIYRTQYDLPYQIYGAGSYGVATMPTADDFEELFQLCEKEWTEVEGVKGYKFTGPNGNSIFLPAAGSRVGNVISESGVSGLYMTGSINPASADFAVAYEFSEGSGTKTTSPRFAGISVRPVTKAVKFDTSKLIKKWYIDLDKSGSCFRHAGPLTYRGTDDSWATVTDGEPASGDSWCWAPVYSENKWIYSDPMKQPGWIEFKEDGTVAVSRGKQVVEGTDTTWTYVEEAGKWTVNGADKTITLEGVDLLGLENILALSENHRENLKIFELTDDAVSIGVVRSRELSGEGPANLCFNYVSEQVWQDNMKIEVSLGYSSGDWSASNGAVNLRIAPEKLIGTHEIVFNNAVNGGVNYFRLELKGFAAEHPNCFVRIDEVVTDGTKVNFNPALFRYGDTEDNGDYCVSMYNCWAGQKASAFSDKDAEGCKGPEDALAAKDSMRVVFTVVSAESNGAGAYPVNFVCINSSWAGSWGTKIGEVEVAYDETAMTYSMTPKTFDFAFAADGVDYSAGPIMAFVEIPNLFGFFPASHFTLDKLSIDGKAANYEAAMVVDSSEGNNYRLELWNCFGATKDNCAFGAPDGQMMPGLGFSDKLEGTLTFQGIYAKQ